MMAGVGTRGRHASGSRGWHRFGFLVCLAWAAGIAIAALLGAALPGTNEQVGTRIGGAEIAGEPRAASGGTPARVDVRLPEAGRRWLDGGRPGDRVRA